MVDLPEPDRPVNHTQAGDWCFSRARASLPMSRACQWMFEDAASEADQATDMVRARALVQSGRKAIERRDNDALRGIVQDLWKLLPVSAQQRRLGHDSGVR